MATDAGSRPCAFCGEIIKANAIKCRFCGEFLDEGAKPPVPVADDAPSTGVKMMVPVGRSGWAVASGWLGILALVPYPIFAFAIMIAVQESAARPMTFVAMGINVMFAVLAVVTAIGAFTSPKPGKGRATFGIAAGMLACAIYVPTVIFWEPILKYVFEQKIEQPTLPPQK